MVLWVELGVEERLKPSYEVFKRFPEITKIRGVQEVSGDRRALE